jgi:hypothetical protein
MTKAKELSELASAATVTSGNVALSGGLDVDGTTDLDVVDIDGAVNMATTALVTGVLTTTAATVHTNGITMPDNAKAIFGAGSDGSIYSDGSNLKVNTNAFYLNTKDNSEAIIAGVNGGAVTLYHNNASKLATTATGVAITGGVAIGGTGAANTMDDYEEGTGASGASGTGGGAITTTGFASYYTKVGRMVHLQFEFRVTDVSSASGHIKITIPFTSLDYSAGTLRCYDATFDGSPLIATAPNSSYAYFATSKTGSATQELLSTGYYFGSLTYATT